METLEIEKGGGRHTQLFMYFITKKVYAVQCTDIEICMAVLTFEQITHRIENYLINVFKHERFTDTHRQK